MQVFRRIFFSRWQLWPCVQSVAPVVGRVSDRGWDGAGSNMRTQSLACQSWQQAKTHIAWHQWAQTCHTSKRPIFDHLVAHACISRAANKDINKDPQGMRQCKFPWPGHCRDQRKPMKGRGLVPKGGAGDLGARHCHAVCCWASLYHPFKGNPITELHFKGSFRGQSSAAGASFIIIGTSRS